MTLKERFQQARPGRFFLDEGDIAGLQAWAVADERVLSADRAGEGNMNCTLRVRTDKRTFILKQARPWVEKYPAIEAPDERALVEAAFYETVQTVEAVAGCMPKLLRWDKASRILMLEDLGPARDCTDLYAGASLSLNDLSLLTQYLEALHSHFREPELRTTFANRAMRALNHEHIFALPLQRNNGLDLDKITPGLQNAASGLIEDAAYCKRVNELGGMYLGEGSCLIHGDFFPGSWIRTAKGLRVIDPEFCFFGLPEFDYGVWIAHLRLSGSQAEVSFSGLDAGLVRGFAGVEIMRRLIGVAQLPVHCEIEEKRELLELSRKLVLQ